MVFLQREQDFCSSVFDYPVVSLQVSVSSLQTPLTRYVESLVCLTLVCLSYVSFWDLWLCACNGHVF